MKRIRSAQLVLLRSFLIMITIVMAFLLAFFFFVRASVEKEALENNYEENTFLRTIIDEKLKSVSLLAEDIVYKPKTMLPIVSGDKSVLTELEMYTLVGELQSYSVSNNIVGDLFIYYPEFDHIVGKLGSYQATSYYYLHTLSKNGYDEWRKAILDSDVQGFTFAPNSNGQELLYCRNFNMGKDGETKFKVIFQIDQIAAQDILEQSNTRTPHQLVAILGENQQPFAYSGNPDLVKLTEHVETNVSSYNQRKGNYFVSVQSSNIRGLTYFMATSRNDVFQVSTNITIILLICVLCCLCASILLAFYLSAKNSRPLDQILRSIQGEKGEDVSDAFGYINQKVGDLMVKNASALKQLDKQQELLTSSFVQSILGMDLRDETAIGSMADLHGVSLENLYFCTVVVRFNQLLDHDVFERFATQLTEELSNDTQLLLGGMLNDQYVFILNYDADDKKETPVEVFANELDCALHARDIHCRIAVGSVYLSPSGLAASYAEALYLLDRSESKIAFYVFTDIEKSGVDGRKQFQDFQRLLAARDYVRASSLLDDLFYHYIGQSVPPEARYREHAVLNQLYEAVLTQVQDKEYGTLLTQKAEELLLCSHPARDFRRSAGEVLTLLANLDGEKNEHDGSIAHKAKLIIDTTYDNPMLGLTSIADQLSVSASYVSRIFKKQYGQGISEYVSRLRIQHAKELIARGELNVKTIALSVGFSSDVSFIRVFKKYENITPGKYTTGKNIELHD